VYHPYFRGKQYELITIRETAPLLARSQFVPIIEPVKETLGGLERTLKCVCDAEGRAVVVVNPHHGDLAEDGEGIGELLTGAFRDQPCIEAGILLKEDTGVAEVEAFIDRHAEAQLAFVHAGFTDAAGLVAALGRKGIEGRHVFFEPHCGKLYRKHFAGAQRILLRDGFKKRRNADQPPLEIFSDLHVTYPEEGMNGFGDFLIVGDEYSETGGPAYAVAIHLTFVDSAKDNQMYIYHFVSRRKDTPTDPAGKFAEALDAMMNKLAEPGSQIFESTAVAEFRELHAKRHFPGLGYVKKLSMKHHIETLANFLEPSHG
jgi:hypothetical protein